MSEKCGKCDRPWVDHLGGGFDCPMTTPPLCDRPGCTDQMIMTVEGWKCPRFEREHLLLARIADLETQVSWKWIKCSDRMPDMKEPVVYLRRNPRGPAPFHVGIAYWTVSEKWQPEHESTENPTGFIAWMPLPEVLHA